MSSLPKAERLDPRHAELFIELLTGSVDSPVTFQTFDDSKARLRKRARVLHGTLAEHLDALQVLNSEGAGIFVTVNETDGRGRTAENIIAVRAVFADFDQGAPERFALDPTFVVQSARGPHPYWVLEPGAGLKDFSVAQRQLAIYYGSDLAVHDTPRVMRLPGFLHRKGDPLLVRVEGESLQRYALAAVLAAHPVVKAPPKRLEPALPGPLAAGEKIPRGRRHEAWKTYAAQLHNDGVPFEQKVRLMMAFAAEMFEEPDDAKDEQARKLAGWYEGRAATTPFTVSLPADREPGEDDDPDAGPAAASEPLASSPATPERSAHVTVTWAEYMAEEAPSVPSLVGDGLLVKAGGYTLVGGDTGVGKTILICNLLLHLADGREEFLGFPLPGRVVPSLILEAEGNRYKFRDWIAHIARNLGIKIPPAISFHQRRAELTIEGSSLEQMIVESGSEVVFLDTIGRFWSGNENDATEWRSGVVLPLAKLGDALDAAFLFGDHYNKSLERQGSQKVRGTPAKIQDCGAAMRLEIGAGGKASRVLHVDRVRDGALPDPPLRKLRIDLVAGTVVLDDSATAEGGTDSPPTPDVKLVKIAAIVQDICSRNGGVASAAMIKIRVKSEFTIKDAQAERAIASVLEAELIWRAGRGSYCMPGGLLEQ